MTNLPDTTFDNNSFEHGLSSKTLSNLIQTEPGSGLKWLRNFLVLMAYAA